jgi:hypothetical protein
MQKKVAEVVWRGVEGDGSGGSDGREVGWIAKYAERAKNKKCNKA